VAFPIEEVPGGAPLSLATVTEPVPVATTEIPSSLALAVPDGVVEVPVDELVAPGGPTLIDWSTCGAASKLLLPAWFASTTQSPVLVKLTAVPLTEHAPGVEEASIVNVTGRPEVAVAAT
jgi:hypothetical protein